MKYIYLHIVLITELPVHLICMRQITPNTFYAYIRSMKVYSYVFSDFRFGVLNLITCIAFKVGMYDLMFRIEVIKPKKAYCS